MRVFVTGASGWIGSATVDELLGAGHEVVGLARSDGSAAALERTGATVLRGDLDDLGAIRSGAKDADAVIHLANKHDFVHPEVSNKAEREAVETIGEALVGTDRPFLLASGIAGLATGRLATEQDPSPAHGPDSPRGGGENRGLEFVAQGVRVMPMRFAPTVHGPGDHGFVAELTRVARERGVAGYVGEGHNRWGAVAISDAARLVRLAVEDATGGQRVHAVAETGIETREIAAAIGRSLGIPTASIDPDDALAHFGWIGTFFGFDLAASSTWTQERFGWTPTGPTLLTELDAKVYAV